MTGDPGAMLTLPTPLRRVLIQGEDRMGLAEYLRAEGRVITLAPGPAAAYDAVVLLDTVQTLDACVAWLAPEGLLVCHTGEPRAEIELRFAACGLRPYDEPGAPEDAPCAAVHGTYDPLNHARALRDAGRIEWAAEILARVPGTFYADPHRQVAVCVEQQRCLLACARASGQATLSLALFFRAQKAFFRAVYIDPHAHKAYRVQAEFWNHIGRPDRAAALLRSIQASAKNDACAALLARLGNPETPAPPETPRIEFPPRTPRLLALVIEPYDPGMDVLYDGLCTVLGEEHVTEYPWKPLLHGERHEEADDYPTTFDHPGEARSLDWICAALEEGAFDAVLHADILNAIPREAMGRILESAGNLPFFIVYGLDDASNNFPILLHHLGLPEARVAGYFKREMIAGVAYGPKAVPLPLSYPDGRVPAKRSIRRTRALFWAGNRYYGLRRLYLEHLEAATGIRFDRKYGQDEYARALDEAMIGLSLCGFGFDTIRYWEIPAHGGVLLAERPPITIPHDFTDLENAVFFRDLPEFMEKLNWCLHHPERLPAIAAEGHRHFLAHHTASARARQLLAHMDRLRRG